MRSVLCPFFPGQRYEDWKLDDPAGQGRSCGGSVLNMDAVALGPLGQISRSVTDIASSEAWYRDVLGLRHLYTFGSLSFFDCGGTRLFLSAGDGPVHEESILYFRVDDMVLTRRVLGERGVVFTHEPHVIHTHEDGTEEWMAFFVDLEDRPLAMMAQRRP